MAFFVRALQDRNPEALLECFSRRKKFAITGTSEAPHDTVRFSFAQLQKGLQPGGDFVGIMFGEDFDDSFRDYVEQTGAQAWQAKGGGRFEPPMETSLPVFIRWGKEGKRYVVQEIAFPGG